MDILFGHPAAFLLVLAVGVVAGIAIEKYAVRSARERRRAYWEERSGRMKIGPGLAEFERRERRN